MSSKITRQLSASVYTDPFLRWKLYGYLHKSFNAEAESFGINLNELFKHVLNARRIEMNYYKNLLLLILICVFSWQTLDILSPTIREYRLNNIAIPEVYTGAFLICRLTLGLGLLIIPIVVMVKALKRRKFLKDNFYKSDYNKDFRYKRKNKKLISTFLKRLGKNVIVYSGYSPFIGSGRRFGGWSFVVDHTIGKTSLLGQEDPIDFELDDIWEEVHKEIELLQIRGLKIKDILLVNGKDIRGTKELLPSKYDHPVSELSLGQIATLRGRNISSKRVYKMIQITDWGGDLVFTCYFRVSKGKEGLFIESNYYLLHPIRSKYRSIDTQKAIIGFTAWMRWTMYMLIKSAVEAVLAVFMVVSYARKWLIKLFGTRERELRKLVGKSPSFDYGANHSIREVVADNYYSYHFQELDISKFMKTVEKRLLNSVGNFLEDRNIDTSDFKERESSVLNNGVIVTGGNFKAKNMSFGQKIKNNFGIK